MQPTRMRRHRWLTLTMFFVSCSLGQVVLSATMPADTIAIPIEWHTSSDTPMKEGASYEDDIPNFYEAEYGPIDIPTHWQDTPKQEDTISPLSKSHFSYKPEGEISIVREPKAYPTPPYYPIQSTPWDKWGMPTTDTPEEHDEYVSFDYKPTLRPIRKNCTPPAIEQFPRPLMGQSARKHGGLVIHILVAVFTYIGLAIVCNHYFLSSLNRICKELQLAPDVAGATFMAAGSSTPMLATVVINVFHAQDDIGVSGMIGSTVFKIFFVISMCVLCAGTASRLNWWPLCRDCFFYAISILIIFLTTATGVVDWPEALSMLIMYVVYCVALRFNTTLERWALKLLLPPRDKEPGLVAGHRSEGGPAAAAAAPGQQPQLPHLEAEQAPAPGQQHQLPQQPSQTAPAAPAYYKAKEYDPETAVDPLVKPIGANLGQLAYWLMAFPVHWACRRTIPDCRGRWYPVSFLVSMLWISFYSYFMVWMVTIIGSTLGIPDTIMSLTFVAAAMSVPEALFSFAVIKEGYGNMAVSNAVGSNVFDVLVCLGLPWFIQTFITHPGSYVNVISKGLVYTTVCLSSTVVYLVVATCATGWKLDRKYGVVLMIWYLLVITIAGVYELNILGNFNPPECISPY